jgi:hypothetical protein
MKNSTRATNDLEKIRKYTNMLSGVLARVFIPNRNNPSPRVSNRRDDVSLNFAGGIGMTQMIAQIAKKISMFNVLA